MSKFEFNFSCALKDLTNKMSNFVSFQKHIEYFHISESNDEINKSLNIDDRKFNIYFRVGQEVLKDKNAAFIFL